jgi:hypothetical protein
VVHVEAKDEDLGNLTEYIHLDHVRDSSGNWSTRKASKPITQQSSEYAKYSFLVIKEWDMQGGMVDRLRYEILIIVRFELQTQHRN